MEMRTRPWFVHRITRDEDHSRCIFPGPAFIRSPWQNPAIGREREHSIFRTLRGGGVNTHLHIFFARRDVTDNEWYFHGAQLRYSAGFGRNETRGATAAQGSDP